MEEFGKVIEIKTPMKLRWYSGLCKCADFSTGVHYCNGKYCGGERGEFGTDEQLTLML